VPELKVRAVPSGEYEYAPPHGSATGICLTPLPSTRTMHTLPRAHPLNKRAELSGDQINRPPPRANAVSPLPSAAAMRTW